MSEHLVEHAVAAMLDGNAWIEIAVAFVAYFVVSFLWWGPIFGKKWAKEMGMDPDMKPDGKTMGKAMVLQVVGTFLIAFVLWHVMTAFAISTNDPTVEELSMASAMIGAVFIWLGFFVPTQLGKLAWENGTWMLAAINGFGHLVGLSAMAAALALL